jgi:hypothetical protein
MSGVLTSEISPSPCLASSMKRTRKWSFTPYGIIRACRPRICSGLFMKLNLRILSWCFCRRALTTQ